MRDAWKDDGNCDECRRQAYCTKICRAGKRWVQQEMKRRMQAAREREAQANERADQSD